MSAPELKPCPFCGEKSSLMVDHCAGTVRKPAYRVKCDNCGASCRYSDQGNHVAAWNTRADLHDATKAQIAALVEAAQSAHDALTHALYLLPSDCNQRLGMDGALSRLTAAIAAVKGGAK